MKFLSPGPWHLWRGIDRKLYVVTDPPQPGERFIGDVVAHPTTSAHSDGNLALIANARNMLEALRLVVRDHHPMHAKRALIQVLTDLEYTGPEIEAFVEGTSTIQRGAV